MSSIDNNAERIVEEMLYFRNNFSKDDVKYKVLEYCRSKINVSEKQLKYEQLFIDIPDSTIRKLKYAGFLVSSSPYSVKLNDMFQDILEDFADLNDDIVCEFSTGIDYINYMSTPHNFISKKFDEITEGSQVDSSTLGVWSEKLNEANVDIDSTLLDLSNKKYNNKHELIADIPSSILLEFLFSIKLHESCKGVKVKPNYISDGITGFPIYHAPAGKPDIELYFDSGGAIVELTLLSGDQDQLTKEMIPITDHLRNFLIEEPNAKCWYISPYIGYRIQQYSKFVKFEDNIDLILNSIQEAIAILNEYN